MNLVPLFDLKFLTRFGQHPYQELQIDGTRAPLRQRCGKPYPIVIPAFRFSMFAGGFVVRPRDTLSAPRCSDPSRALRAIPLR